MEQTIQQEQREDSAKERVRQELNELKERIVKLTAFLYGETPALLLSRHMICKMKEQLSVMQRYAEILQDRLLIWDKSDEEISKEYKFI